MQNVRMPPGREQRIVELTKEFDEREEKLNRAMDLTRQALEA